MPGKKKIIPSVTISILSCLWGYENYQYSIGHSTLDYPECLPVHFDLPTQLKGSESDDIDSSY
jgi:hypothetical protein